MKFNNNKHLTAGMLKSSLSLLILITISLAAFSQDTLKKPTWWLGIAGGANFNSYTGYTSALNGDITASPAFGKGQGVGGYIAGVIEYHPKNSVLGLMLQEGADSRMAIFNKNDRRLEARISYFTIEPSLVYMPTGRHFYLYVGPRLGLIWSTRFTYREGDNPTYPQKHKNYDAYIKNLDKATVSIQGGIGYDFVVSRKTDKRLIVASPFVTYLPSLNQNLRTIESLELNTLRAGVILKAGFGVAR